MFGMGGHMVQANVIRFIAPAIISGGRAEQAELLEMPEMITAQNNMVPVIIKEMRVVDQCGLRQHRLL